MAVYARIKHAFSRLCFHVVSGVAPCTRRISLRDPSKDKRVRDIPRMYTWNVEGRRVSLYVRRSIRNVAPVRRYDTGKIRLTEGKHQ